MTLVLPPPPTANLYWRDRVVIPKGVRIPRGTRPPYVHRYRTDEADEYARRVAWLANAAGVDCIDAPQEVAVTLRWFRGRRIGDLDNHLKVVLDALQGWAYGNDKQIAELHAYRYYDKANPRAEIDVAAIIDPQFEF